MAQLLTIDEVCDQLRVSPNWVYARATTGELPSAIIGGRRKFRQADVDAYIERVVDPLDLDESRPASLRCDRWTRKGTVYFVGLAAGRGPIKIGVAHDVATRLAGLNASNPLPLKVLATATGGRWYEREMHRRFWHLRDHGEWFRAEPDLLDFISAIPELGA